MCSSTFGPAMEPSLLTWPITNTVIPCPFASCISAIVQLLHLPDAARRRIQLLVIERLDRVDDQDVGLFLLYALKNISQASLGQDEQPRALNLQALGAELELVGRLLTGDIQHLRKLPQTAADLEHQRRLADARRAAHEHERALDRSAAENAVELTHAG